MRGIVFHRAGAPLTLEQVPDPEPGPGELILRVGRCGICGSDVHLTESHGWFPEQGVLGHEFAGEVVAIGKDVANYAVGDAVSSMPVGGCGRCAGCHSGNAMLCEAGFIPYQGGFADYVRVGARSSTKLPSTLSLADGALVEPLSVGLHGVALAMLRPGARVLVLGSGPVALAAMFWARRLGAGRMATLSRSLRRADLATAMGTDALVTSGDAELDEVREALGGMPEVVLECIGSPGALERSIQHVQPGGTVISLGFCIKPDAIIPGVATYKQVKLLFSLTYTMDEFVYCAETLGRGALEPRLMVTNTIPLEEVPGMIERMRVGTAETKVLVDPSMG